MKKFLSFVYKEFLHIFRDRRTMLILLGMPIVQIVLFGFAISTDVKHIDVAVVAADRSEAVRRLTERFGANERFFLKDVVSPSVGIEDSLLMRSADLVIVFPGDFDKSLYSGQGAPLQLIADASDPNMASSVLMYSSGIVTDYVADMAGADYKPAGIVPSVRLLYNPRMESAYNFVPGLMGLILMIVCAMMTAVSIVREKETGTMEVLLVSPVKPIFIILAKMVPYFVLSCVNLLTILLLSVFLLGVPVAGSVFWLSIVSFLFITVSLALGLLISTLTQTQVAAMLVSGMVLMMPVIMLSGMMFPIENMPMVLKWLSCGIPARWYITAVKKLMIEGLPVTYVLNEMLILSTMAVALIAVSLANFKNRLE